MFTAKRDHQLGHSVRHPARRGSCTDVAVVDEPMHADVGGVDPA